MSRLTHGEKYSSLFLQTIDTGSLHNNERMIRNIKVENSRISLSIKKEPYYGSSTDRAFATIVFSEYVSNDEQVFIMREFNKTIEYYRKKYHSMFLTNYRNSTKHIARKRISFTLAYKIISNILYKIKGY